MSNISTVNTFAAPSEWQLEQRAIERQRRLAEMLQQDSMAPMTPNNEMAGGYVIRKSPLEGLAKMLKGYTAIMGQNRADERERTLGDRYTAERTDLLARALKAKDGIPATSETIVDEQANDGEGAPAQINAPAVPGSNQAMYKMLMASRFPDMQAAGLSGLTKDEESYTLKPGETRFRGPTQVAALPEAPKYHTVAPGSALVPEPPRNAAAAGVPGTVTPAYTAPDKDEAAKFKAILQGAGIDPDSPQGQALFKQLAVKTATHQPASTVNVSTEKKYGEQFGGLIAKADVDLRDSAQKAPDLAERANNIKQTLASGKVITGTGADIRLQLGKALNLVGASDRETIVNTETMATQLAQNTLDAIKASGLGSGSGFSNADRDFLEKAVGGKITLEAGSIDKLATLAHRAASKTAERWSERLRQIPETAIQGTGLNREGVRVAPLYTPQRRATDALSPAEEAERQRLRQQLGGTR